MSWTLTAHATPAELADELESARAKRLQLAGVRDDLDVEADITAAIGIATTIAETTLGEPYVSAILAGHCRRGDTDPSKFYVSVTGTIEPPARAT